MSDDKPSTIVDDGGQACPGIKLMTDHWTDGSLWAPQDGDQPLRELHDAVEEAVEQLEEEGPPYPETITMERYTRDVVPPEWLSGLILAQALELLDEDHADPDDGRTEPTDVMKAAEAVFLKVVVAEYLVWQHHADGITETIRVAEWIEEERS